MIIAIDAKRFTGGLYEYSRVTSRFTSEDHGYVELNEDADPWIDEDTETRIGRSIPFSFDLPFVFRHDQVRRLQKRKFYQLNPEWTLDLEVDFNGLELFGERVCRIVYPPLGIDGTFQLESVSPDADLSFAKIHVRATSIDARANEWDADAEEGTAPAIPPSTSDTAAPQTPTSLAVLVGDTGGNVRAVLTWLANTTGKTQTAQYKLDADTEWTDVTVGDDDRGVTLNALTAASVYNFRVRVEDETYGASNWATINFTATAIVGTTGALAALSATGSVLKASVTTTQASDAAAAYVEIAIVASGDPVSWTGSTLVPSRASQVTVKSITQPFGARDVYARSVGINGDTGAVSGPVAVTVTQQISTGGSGSSGGGGGGGGRNDGGTGIGGGSESPSQEGGIY